MSLLYRIGWYTHTILTQWVRVRNRCIVYISTHMATESDPFTYLFTYFAYISDISLTTCGILTKQQSPCRETRALLSYREVGVERFELPTSSL